MAEMLVPITALAAARQGSHHEKEALVFTFEHTANLQPSKLEQ